MLNCSSCGYQFEKDRLKQTPTGLYCRICVAIGAPHVNENPGKFGDAKYFLPPLAYIYNELMAAIATRAEAGDLQAEVDGVPAFIVLGKDGEMIEVEDEDGKPLELNTARFSEVEGTDFKKFKVLLPRK